jgi:hypothetical protein
MTVIKFDPLWAHKWGIPKEKLLSFCELRLHDRNYTEFIEMPPPPKKKITDEQMRKTFFKGTLTHASDRTVNMVYERITSDFDHMAAGTLPDRCKDPEKKRPFNESFEIFRQDFLKTATSDIDFMAAYNQEKNRRK